MSEVEIFAGWLKSVVGAVPRSWVFKIDRGDRDFGGRD